MADDPVIRILTAIERLRTDLLVRLDRLEHLQARPQPTPDAIAAGSDIMAHVQNTGDVSADFGAWVGNRRSRSWIEGFSIAPPDGFAPEDLVYRAVLGRDWLSPWVPAGSYCGSRGLAFPLRGFCIGLRGLAATSFEASYSATFVDGSEIGSLAGEQICAAAGYAPLEAFQLILRPRSP